MTNQEAIADLETLLAYIPIYRRFYQPISMGIKALEQTKWIPVSERLPEEYHYVLVSTDAEEIFIADYLGKMNDGTDCFDDGDGMMWEGDVVAWMPLPEPYKAESEVSNAGSN